MNNTVEKDKLNQTVIPFISRALGDLYKIDIEGSIIRCSLIDSKKVCRFIKNENGSKCLTLSLSSLDDLKKKVGKRNANLLESFSSVEYIAQLPFSLKSIVTNPCFCSLGLSYKPITGLIIVIKPGQKLNLPWIFKQSQKLK